MTTFSTYIRIFYFRDDSRNLTPYQVIRSRAGWTLWAIFLINGQGIQFISTLYKVPRYQLQDSSMYLYRSYVTAGKQNGVYWSTAALRLSIGSTNGFLTRKNGGYCSICSPSTSSSKHREQQVWGLKQCAGNGQFLEVK